MIRYILFATLFTLWVSSCKNTAGSDPATAAFDAAYPASYQELSLPEYRRGKLESVTGKDQGVKTVHNVVIISNDPPTYVRDFIGPAMQDLGWRALNARKRLSSDISEDDLFFESYVKGTNKYEINASTIPTGETKIKIALSTFKSN